MPPCNKPIAIIGSACHFPGQSTSPSKLWELLREPRDLLQTIPTNRFNAHSWYHPDGAHHGTSNVTKSYFLAEDPTTFDAQFFGMHPKECEAVDPQQRLLMETVYDSLCSASIPMENLRGSSTACYVGQMCDDWSGIVARDWDSMPQYAATGISRSILSNRVSYFFDWHGPSMTIDTACSSSLVAVHEAVQVLRSGDSNVAIACGTNLILSPGMYIAESNLKMLSPDGRSRMWDEGANGYARGEGVAAVVLKTLSQALKDGDHVECIIRETGFNQDGRTTGLDPLNPDDRPQFFHAHGTGTPAGDPQEAQAISQAFFKDEIHADSKLYVGSIKTIIGHTEGAAGLASLIGTSLALQNKTIPPNMHFNKLAAKVAPFYTNLEVPTTAKPWPKVPPGQRLRASVNSFGFGGANAHAILESFEPETCGSPTDLSLFTPLTFSANTEKSLNAMLATYSEHLKKHESVNIRDIAWTLQSRRSVLALKTTVAGQTAADVSASIDAALEKDENIGIRASALDKPSILGVFTGQGAQWPTMGAELLKASPYVREVIASMDKSLQGLPEADRPCWLIKDELEASRDMSCIAQAAFSQPLCTAVQVVLVDLIKAAGIHFKAVVGHSSGEIGAAYAAGLISARDAIRIAYYRGLYSNLARSSSRAKGAMIAVGTSLEDATELCELEEFEGRLMVAASNAAASVTLSGDKDAVEHAEEIFKDESKFSRKLRVDTAYHSFHMEPCSEPYLKALGGCNLKVGECTQTTWFSSVIPGIKMSQETLSSQYWVDNMQSTVLFSQAVTTAVKEAGPFDLAIEVGPHPALKGPCVNNIEDASGIADIAYTGVLERNKNDVNAFSAALGYIWERFDSSCVDFDNYDKLVSGSTVSKKLAVDLPLYPWDHDRTYWFESRVSAGYRHREGRPHPLLGVKSVEGSTGPVVQWRNILTQREVTWLQSHKLQGQIVFPASGYVSMAFEAITTLAGENSVRLIEMEDFVIGRAISFFDESAAYEVMLTLKIIHNTADVVSATFEVTSCPQGKRRMDLNARGTISIFFGVPSRDVLLAAPIPQFNMVEVEVDRFYKALTDLGYHYSPPFRSMSSLRRRIDAAAGTLTDIRSGGWEDELLLHPGLLDSSFQAVLAAFGSPGDETLWSIHVPTEIKRMILNPAVAASPPGQETVWPWQAAVTSEPHSKVRADIEVFAGNDREVLFEVEGISMVPLSEATAADDCHLFSNFVYDLDAPNGKLAGHNRPTEFDVRLAMALERFSFYWLRQLLETITPEEEDQTLPYYKRMLNWCRFVFDEVKNGEHLHVKPEALDDTLDFVEDLVKPYGSRVDIDLIRAVGQELPVKIRTNGNLVETMVREGMLDDFYEKGMGLHVANHWEANMAAQVTHRYPRMNILEVGGGAGGSTRIILPRLGASFATYTFTDISASFFEAAEERFKEYVDRMIFKTFDMEKDIAEQGFTEGHYDMILSSNALHAAVDMHAMLRNVRRLLKPGGWLINMDTVGYYPCVRSGVSMGGLPSWWVGADTGRLWGPTVDLPAWDQLYRQTGFSGIDTYTPRFNSLHPLCVMATQAVDERVNFLREPLAIIAPDARKDDELVVIGGRTDEMAQIANRAVDLLEPYFSSITHVDSVDVFADDSSQVPACVLNFSELETPVMKEVMHDQPEKLDALKNIFSNARDILWITKGSRAESPYTRMVVAMARALRKEYSGTNFQNVDVDVLDNESPRLIAKSLLRLQKLFKWSKELPPEDLHWSREPEVHLEGGSYYIPRLKTIKEMNDRYNCTKRRITHDLSVRASRIEMAGSELREVSPLKPIPDGEDKVAIRVSKSLLQFVKVPTAGYFFLCYGITESGEAMLAFSNVSESVVIVPRHWTTPHNTKVDPSKALLSIAASLVADQVMTVSSSHGSMLVHDPDTVVAVALSKQAAAKRIRIFFTTSKAEKKGPNWIYIHPHAPRRLLKQVLPKDVSLFVNLSGSHDSQLVSEISTYLPAGCTLSDQSPFFGSVVESRPTVNPVLSDLLKAKAVSLPIPGSKTILPLKEVPSHSGELEQLTVVDWDADSVVTVNVQPIDSGENLFKPDRTYLMVGLSGEVGQSITQWMIRHGARYVVLTSRNPKVDTEWIESLEDEYSATVKAMHLDITDQGALYTCYNKIARTMPAIGGVAHGAMVLVDSQFQNMDYEDLMKVLRPKVLGAIHLDELFSEDTLDFFILFSSITGVLGRTGQTNYIAANAFMEALGRQRRQRGLAASTICISSLIGIGYIERTEHLDAEYFARSGFRNISEQDLHLLFAEAIVRGRPDCTENNEIVTGIVPTHEDLESREMDLRDIRFSHLALGRSQARADGTSTMAIPVRIQLQSAMTKDEVLDIVQAGFVARIKKVLRIPSEDDFSLTASLVEQGIDSLVAVEVRSWLLKELDVDMPVLKVLGGASTSSLLKDAVERIPLEVAPNLGFEAHNVSYHGVPSDLAPDAQPVVKKESALATDVEPGRDGEAAVAAMRWQEQKAGEQLSETADTFSSTNGNAVVPKNKTAGEEVKADVSIRSYDALVESEVTEKISFGQSGFWFLDQVLKDKTTFNMAVSVRLEGPVRIKDMEKALQAVVLRHEALRTRYFTMDKHMEIPMQGVIPSSMARLKWKQIESEADAQKDLDDIRDHVWDLGHWETTKVSLLSLSERIHFLIIGCHHIVMDGISFNIFYADLEKAYNGQKLPVLPDSSQFRAFAKAQRQHYESGKMNADLDYYRTIVPKDPKPLPLFPFAQVKERVPLETYYEHAINVRIDATLADKIKTAARKLKSTTFHFYLAAFQVLILRLVDCDDFFIGIADANRTDDKFSGTIGFFLNLLPIRFERSAAKIFGEAVQQTRTKTYASLSHSKLPFDVLLENLDIPRSSSYTPLFQVFVDYRQGVQERKRYMGIKAEGENWYTAGTGYDVTLDIIENVAGDARLDLKVQKELYTVESAQLLLDVYVNLLRQFAENPDVKWNVPGIWPTQRIEQALTLGRGNFIKYEWSHTVAHRIDDMIQKHASNMAIKDGTGKVLTYSQLNDRVNTICAALVASGASDGARVAVFQQPTADWVCSLLAIFRAGAVYIPLDPRFPLARLASIVNEARPQAILAHNETWDKIDALSVSNAKAVNVTALPGSHKAMPNLAKADGSAVILFTSGSTGTPKGMHISHTNLVKHMEAFLKQDYVAENAVYVLQQSAYTFDRSLGQILTALTNGGALYVVPANQRGDPVSVTQTIASEGITYIDATASEYLLWFRYAGKNLKKCKAWKLAITCGEAATNGLLASFRSLGMPVKLVNNYGPAENTIGATFGELPYNSMTSGGPISIGSPLPGYSVYIVDEKLQPLPVGHPGEIIIGGVGVVDGYLNNEELTKNKFLPDIFSGSGTMYRTGDRGRMLQDGALFYEGRMDGDTQIKLRGIRMELEDIESVIIRAGDGAITCAVVSLRDEEGAEFLVAHVVFSSSYTGDKDTFVKHLPTLLPLPQYMIPALFVPLNSLPLTPHFKVDRTAIKALSLPERIVKSTVHVGGLTATESRLANLWQQIIPGAPAAAPDSGFFHVGGNSLLLVKLQALIREALDVTLRLTDLMSTGTLSDMARLIEDTVSVKKIDWKTETAISEPFFQIQSATKAPRKSTNLTVILTGATGLLGRNILRKLAADPRVSKIYALAVRSHGSEERIPIRSHKIVVKPGDLSKPLLGLSEDDAATLSHEADIIFHAGANRSFWDSYYELRFSNVTSVKEIIRLALPCRIPVHFVSSGEVAAYGQSTPPDDGSNGYVATKWAAEHFLGNAAEKLGLQVVVHRPQSSKKDIVAAPPEIFAELLDLTKRMNKRPVLDGLSGSLGIIPIEVVVDRMADSLFNSATPAEMATQVNIVEHTATMNVDIDVFANAIKGDEGLEKIQGIDALTWTGMAKKLGWSQFLVNHEIVMSNNGDEVVSRR